VEILAINGSPRKEGNTATLLKTILKATGAEKTELIHLADYKILPCTACGECWETQNCPIDDDLEKVVEKMLKSDGIILGSPVYYGAVSPEMKALIDRSGELLGSRGNLLKNKVGGAIVVARRWGHLTAWTTMLLYLLEMRMVVPGAGWSAATAKLPKQVLKDEEGMERAKELGKAVANIIRKMK